jgi:hypothetical protein
MQIGESLCLEVLTVRFGCFGNNAVSAKLVYDSSGRPLGASEYAGGVSLRDPEPALIVAPLCKRFADTAQQPNALIEVPHKLRWRLEVHSRVDCLL